MGNHWEAIEAAKLGGAHVEHEPATDAADALDTPEALAKERYADVMASRGVSRQVAAQCAEAIFALQAARDRELSAVFVGDVDGACAAAAGMAWLMQGDAADKLWQALSRAREARDSKLSLGCLFFAQGKPPYGVWSMRALAEAHGVSVEAVSNEVSEYQEILGLPRNAQQKSPEALRVYARTNGAMARKTREET